MIFYILVSYSLRFTSINTILRANLCSQIFMFIICSFLLKMGLLFDYVITKPHGLAHDFGYGNSNTFAQYYIYFIITVYLIMYKQWKTFLKFLIVLLSVIMYYYTQARSIILVTSLLLLSLFLHERFLRTVITSKISVTLSILLIPLFFYLITLNAFSEQLSDITSNRSLYLLSVINEMSLNNFVYGMETPEGIIIDNVFMLLLLFGGLGSLLFVIYNYYKIMTSSNYPIQFLVVLFTIFLYGFTESCFLNPFISGTYLFWILIIGNKSLIKNNEHISCLHHVQPSYITSSEKC